jgi:hypothetical protein
MSNNTVTTKRCDKNNNNCSLVLRLCLSIKRDKLSQNSFQIILLKVTLFQKTDMSVNAEFSFNTKRSSLIGS